MTNYITITILTLIYTASICTILGSINPFARKTGAGKIKQAILDWGYRYSIYWTNFLGLWISGTLQCSPFIFINKWFLLLALFMPICYTVAIKYFGDTKYAEYMWGGIWSLGIVLIIGL